MATYETISLTGVTFVDNGSGVSSFGASELVLIVEPGHTFTYTVTGIDPLDGWVTVDLMDSADSRYISTVNNTHISQTSEVSISNLHWGSGNVTQLLSITVFDEITGAPSEHLFILGGDALPAITSAAAFQAFIATVTGFSSITSGPFAPNTPIDLGDVAGATTSTSSTLQGTSEADVIQADEQNDDIHGNDGDDQIYGGAGVDSLYGGNDNDVFKTGTGADFVYGGDGIDTVDYSDSTNAQVINLTTSVNVGGEAHNDTLVGIENVIGSDTRGDQITGTSGTNEIYGMGAGDILRGANGDDFLYGGENNDYLFGGRGADHLDGGNGIDWAMYNDSNEGVSVDLGIGSGTGGFAQGDSYTDIENIRGSFHDDTLAGDDGTNKIIGDQGNDFIDGAGGRDNLRGGTGNDTMDGGAGIDGLRGDAGDDIFVFKAGNELDNILDFDDFGNDMIDLSAFNLSSFSDVQNIMSQVGGHVKIDLGGGDILLLRNTQLSDMGADDFIL